MDNFVSGIFVNLNSRLHKRGKVTSAESTPSDAKYPSPQDTTWDILLPKQTKNLYCNYCKWFSQYPLLWTLILGFFRQPKSISGLFPRHDREQRGPWSSADRHPNVTRWLNTVFSHSQLELVTAKCATCANSFINGDTPKETLTDDWEQGEQRDWHTVNSMHDNKTAWMTFHRSLCRAAIKDRGA